MCVLIEGAICALYLIITSGRQIPLQQVSALGSIIAYTMSALALLYARKNAYKNNTITFSSIWLPILGLINCALLMASCVYSLVNNGAASLTIFASLLVFGIFMFWYTAQATESGKNA
jgi:L-asparagine transporter-like permease